MATDGIGQISVEQLMAMSLTSNGQLTSSTSSSSTSSTSSDAMSYAFQILMQNYLNESSSSSSEELVNNATSSVTQNENSESAENSGTDSEDAMTDLVNSATNKQVQQKYSAGQNLLDIPLVINESNNVNKTNSTGTIYSNSASGTDLERIYAAVDAASEKYGVDKNLILAIIKQESNFDSTAVSSAGASGLMQIMNSNLSSLGINDVFNIEENIDGGTSLLKQNLNQYNGNIEMALMAYNAGSGTMQSRGVTSASDLYKMPTETQNYVPSVLSYYNQYSNQ